MISIRCAIAVLAAALWAPAAFAQRWAVDSGVTTGLTYNDNYTLSTTNKQAATTFNVTPFATVSRSTENSSVSGILGLGWNYVTGAAFGDYWNGRAGLTGTLTEDRSTYGAYFNANRNSNLQSQLVAGTVQYARTVTGTLSSGATYSYALSERWTAGVNAGVNGTNYSAVQSGATTNNNRGYSGGGSLTYLWSPETQVIGAATYSHFRSNVSETSSISPTIAVTRKFSENLTVSGNVGYFWSDNTALTSATVCPTEPIQCQLGLARPIVILSGRSTRDTGTLFGGNVRWSLTDRTTVAASLAQNLIPSATGIITKATSAGATLSHQFSERLSARAGVGYIRQQFPTVQSATISNNFYSGSVGMSYKLAERWTLDAGFTHTRSTYSQNNQSPEQNIAFITLGYGWPTTDVGMGWFGTAPEFGGFPGAGGSIEGLPPAVTSPGQLPGAVAPGLGPGLPSPSTSPGDSTGPLPANQ